MVVDKELKEIEESVVNLSFEGATGAAARAMGR
jgi:hypothetical protein